MKLKKMFLFLSIVFVLCLVQQPSFAVVQIGSSTGLPGTITQGVSAVQSPFSLSTVTTVAHGLGSQPFIIHWYLENLVAEGGYSIGDKVFTVIDNSASTGGFSITADSTNIKICTSAAQLLIANKTTGAAFTLTLADWKIVAIPYKLN